MQEIDLDVEFEFGPHDGDEPKMTVLLDPILWKLPRSNKDLNPELLRWFLRLRNSKWRLLTKIDVKYGLARDLQEALLGRQPKVLHLLFLFLCFIFLLVCFA